MYKYPEKITLSAFVTVALLHTKQTLIVMALPVFLYYLLNNLKAAMKYFLACTCFMIAELLAIHYIFPLYWAESIYTLSKTIYGFELSTALYNIAHISFRYVAFLALSLAGIILLLSHEKGNIFLRIKNVFVNLRHEYIMLIMLNIISSLFFLIASFARNGGDGVKYCGGMLGPSILIFSFIIWKYALVSFDALFKKSLVIFLLTAAAFCSVMFANFKYVIFNLDDVMRYADAWETIRQYDDGSPIYLGMVASNYMADEANAYKDYIYYDDGQVEYFNSSVNDPGRHGILKSDNFNKRVAEILHVDKIYSAGREYVNTVRRMIAEKKFSLVVCSGLGSIIDFETLEKNYKLIKSLELLEATEYSRIHNFYVPR